MKKILVPTDFSASAEYAAKIAIALAKKAKAEIYFLHLHLPLSSGGHAAMHGAATNKKKHQQHDHLGHVKGQLQSLVAKAEREGVSAKLALVLDDSRQQIEKSIKAFSIDLVVMGSHGVRGLREILGSNTQKLVRHSIAPVLVVKEKVKKLEIKNIVFASTFEEDVHKPFMKVIEFADLMDAKIHLLYVNTPFLFKETDTTEANMKAFLKKCPRGTCTINIYNSLNEEIGIQKFTKTIKADMIALTTHGRTGFMRMISHSITESLVNHSGVPVLSVNIKTK